MVFFNKNQCAASISYQLTMISHTVYTWMTWLTFDDKQLSQQSFKVLSIVELITEYLVLELQSLLQQFSICWVFSTVRFYMSPKIERITLFLKILWLNILAVSPAYTQGPYQAQTIHKQFNSWGGHPDDWWKNLKKNSIKKKFKQKIKKFLWTDTFI